MDFFVGAFSAKAYRFATHPYVFIPRMRPRVQTVQLDLHKTPLRVSVRLPRKAGERRGVGGKCFRN